MIGQSIHDDVVRNDAQRVNLFHEDVGRDHVELDVPQESSKNLTQLGAVGRVALLLAPHQSSLEEGKMQLLNAQRPMLSCINASIPF